VGVTISHAQRDAVYDRILDRLSGIEDIWLAASGERYETADRLGREYSDELRLVLDDLGWGDGPGVEAIELTTEPDCCAASSAVFATPPPRSAPTDGQIGSRTVPRRTATG
jgi:hypothetical protein